MRIRDLPSVKIFINTRKIVNFFASQENTTQTEALDKLVRAGAKALLLEDEEMPSAS